MDTIAPLTDEDVKAIVKEAGEFHDEFNKILARMWRHFSVDGKMQRANVDIAGSDNVDTRFSRDVLNGTNNQ